MARLITHYHMDFIHTRDPVHHNHNNQSADIMFFSINFRHILFPSRRLIATNDHTRMVSRSNYLSNHATITERILVGIGMASTEIPRFASRIETYALDEILNSDSDVVLNISLLVTAVTERSSLRQQQDQAMAYDRSFGEVRTVPATQDSIRALQEELNDVGLGGKTCSICLEKMSFGDRRVVKMPCSHAFHKDCIVRWLETSHLCPLCRYSMPTTTTTSSLS